MHLYVRLFPAVHSWNDRQFSHILIEVFIPQRTMHCPSHGTVQCSFDARDRTRSSSRNFVNILLFGLSPGSTSGTSSGPGDRFVCPKPASSTSDIHKHHHCMAPLRNRSSFFVSVRLVTHLPTNSRFTIGFTQGKALRHIKGRNLGYA